MPFELIDGDLPDARPVHLVSAGLDRTGLPPAVVEWARANGYSGEAGKLLAYPDDRGRLAGVLYGLPREADGFAPLAIGGLARALPPGDWRLAAGPDMPHLATLALLMGSYRFEAYFSRETFGSRLAAPQGADLPRARRIAEGVFLARDLVNTPANDMGPAALEKAARDLAARHGAEIAVTAGDDLAARNFPMIHAVGRAGAEAPRLVDLSWGPEDAPKVTLVGKGVCFDTGGLDIKTSSGMLLMKKDMGGAANALGLASMVMAARLKLRLRVLIPAVENAISANAFRPGDVLRSRLGPTVEIGNTDAEGRLVLADALALADEQEPEMLVDLATLTGAARVALGPDLPPYYTDDEALADALETASREACDPLWRMPLWQPYAAKLSSKIADMNNVTTDGFAGSVTAALFLKRFVNRAKSWAHLDIFAWNPADRPHGLAGGEAQAIRALETLLVRRFGG